MCGNVEDAGDVAQESLISMARALPDFRGDSSVSSWLYTIARRFCIKKRRRSKFAPSQDASLDAPESGARERLADGALNPEQQATNQELATALTRAIDALEPDYREVLVLRDVEGLTAPEVARVLGMSVDAVKSRLHRARVAVRQTIAPLLARPSRLRPAASARQAPATRVTAPCPDIATLFSQHLEGDLAPAVCATMEAHLAGCSQCRTDCDALKRTLAVCSALPAPDVPAPVAAAVRTAIASFLKQR
jgi:RNA polymerase sigma-70 factor (ECF subfamily)